MNATERLAEIKARAEAATEGPWDYQPWSQYALPSGDYAESILLANASDDGEIIRGLRDEDGEFIAHARTDAPALVAALEAVLELHRPVHRIFSWSSGIRDEEPCPDCHGKAGVHDCGCWADEDMTYSCATCRSEKGGGVDYPCPTVTAINAYLTGDKS